MLNSYYEDYEPTKAARAIQNFVMENLSNWYVRLNRKRYWGGEYSDDKLSAYQTLYTCLITIAKLSAPLAPFYMDKLYRDLNHVTKLEPHISVHLAEFPVADPASDGSQPGRKNGTGTEHILHGAGPAKKSEYKSPAAASQDHGSGIGSGDDEPV